MAKKNRPQNSVTLESTTPEIKVNNTPEISKFELITSLCRDGLPAYLVDTTISFTWENKTISLDIRDCDVLDNYRFPVPGQERRTDFVVPHFLGLSADSVVLPCKIDGEEAVLRFQHLKATKLLNAYFSKIREYAKTLSDIIARINEMTSEEYRAFLSEKVLENSDFQNRVKM